MKYLLTLLATTALAQEPLDVTMGGAYPAFPDYLQVSCGGVKLEVTEGANNLAMVRATTNCHGSGRGSKTIHYLACTRVQFAPDRYTIESRERVLYVVSTTQPMECPQS